MINTIRYAAQTKKVENGKPINILIPPRIVLTEMGAFVDVTITHPRAVQDKLREKGQNIPIFFSIGILHIMVLMDLL